MDTITFLTFFLGLTLGSQDIRMSATANVKRIVVRLDGAQVAVLTPPAWEAALDFGETLEPHRVTATAFDGSGNEIVTVDQKVNLPRPNAEAKFLVESDAAGVPRTAQLVWSSLNSQIAREVAIDLDGHSLKADRNMKVALPALSPKPHVLRGRIATAAG